MLVSKEDIENMQTAASDPNVDALMIVDKKTGKTHLFARLRTAEWLKLGKEVVCSSCWHSEGKYKYKEYKYCPNCGAKIIGKEGRE